MIGEVLLTNENYVRSVTNIDNNMQSKFLLSAMRESQEVGLQEIIGTRMLKKLKVLISTNTVNLPANSAYKGLLDECQMYLAYKTIVQLCLISSVKISNGGLQQTSDENLTVLSVDDVWNVRDQYQAKADFFASRLQAYILENKKQRPEISQAKCNEIQAELHSAASTSLWLGGARGKIRSDRALNYIGK